MAKLGTVGLIACLLLAANATMAEAAVPELDPGSASLGLTLLIGGLLALNGRRRRR